MISGGVFGRFGVRRCPPNSRGLTREHDEVCLEMDGRPAEGLEDRCDVFVFRPSSGSWQYSLVFISAFEVIPSREEECQ